MQLAACAAVSSVGGAAYTFLFCFACAQLVTHRSYVMSRAKAKMKARSTSAPCGVKVDFRTLLLSGVLLAAILRMAWIVDAATCSQLYNPVGTSVLLALAQSLILALAVFVVLLWRRLGSSAMRAERIKSAVIVGRYKWALLGLLILLGAAAAASIASVVEAGTVHGLALTWVMRALYAAFGVGLLIAGIVYSRRFRSAVAGTNLSADAPRGRLSSDGSLWEAATAACACGQGRGGEGGGGGACCGWCVPGGQSGARAAAMAVARRESLTRRNTDEELDEEGGHSSNSNAVVADTETAMRRGGESAARPVEKLNPLLHVAIPPSTTTPTTTPTATPSATPTATLTASSRTPTPPPSGSGSGVASNASDLARVGMKMQRATFLAGVIGTVWGVIFIASLVFAPLSNEGAYAYEWALRVVELAALALAIHVVVSGTPKVLATGHRALDFILCCWWPCCPHQRAAWARAAEKRRQQNTASPRTFQPKVTFGGHTASTATTAPQPLTASASFHTPSSSNARRAQAGQGGQANLASQSRAAARNGGGVEMTSTLPPLPADSGAGAGAGALMPPGPPPRPKSLPTMTSGGRRGHEGAPPPPPRLAALRARDDSAEDSFASPVHSVRGGSVHSLELGEEV